MSGWTELKHVVLWKMADIHCWVGEPLNSKSTQRQVQQSCWTGSWRVEGLEFGVSCCHREGKWTAMFAFLLPKTSLSGFCQGFLRLKSWSFTLETHSRHFSSILGWLSRRSTLGSSHCWRLTRQDAHKTRAPGHQRFLVGVRYSKIMYDYVRLWIILHIFARDELLEFTIHVRHSTPSPPWPKVFLVPENSDSDLQCHQDSLHRVLPFVFHGVTFAKWCAICMHSWQCVLHCCPRLEVAKCQWDSWSHLAQFAFSFHNLNHFVSMPFHVFADWLTVQLFVNPGVLRSKVGPWKNGVKYWHLSAIFVFKCSPRASGLVFNTFDAFDAIYVKRLQFLTERQSKTNLRKRDAALGPSDCLATENKRVSPRSSEHAVDFFIHETLLALVSSAKENMSWPCLVCKCKMLFV